MPVTPDCKINVLLTKIFSLKAKANNRNPKATITKRNDNDAKGLADWTIICPLTNAELQKKTNKRGNMFVIYLYGVITLYS